MWKKDCKRLDNIINTAKKEKELRIWYDSSPCSKCGLLHLIYSLCKIDCKIYVSNFGIDEYAMGGAIEDGKLAKSYEFIIKHPKLTKRQALKKLKLKEYVPNSTLHKFRDYVDKD